MITGLENVTSGDIFIDGQRVNDVAPGKRDISMVFQNYALYPTMTVRENIEFGLINKKVPKEERKRRIDEVCEIVGLTEYLDRKPANLSGGQRQRVALARAMVKQPKVFMMDEPLSNLDAKLRGQMRVELINMHKKMGTTFVYVTHDQVEAMSMATDIVLMDQGKIVQQSGPKELYHNPNCIYTAQFVGSPQTNILDNRLPDGMKLGFRPEKVRLNSIDPADGINIPVTVQTKEMLGSEIIYSLDTPFGMIMCKSEEDVQTDSKITVSIAYDSMYLFGADTMRLPFDEAGRKAVQAAFGGETV
jgi:sn-glycerol 3-phosphate transport system ATP-binding protein